MTMKAFSTTVAVFVALMTIIAMYGNVSAFKCYVCSSSTPTCLENFFLSTGIAVQEPCACCIKTVSSGTTQRRCGTGFAAVACAVSSDNTHVCYSDLCNTANRPPINTLLPLGVLLIAVVVRYIR